MLSGLSGRLLLLAVAAVNRSLERFQSLTDSMNVLL